MIEANVIEPATAREVADRLRAAAEAKQRIRMGGHFTKHLMAGPNDPEAAITMSTTRLDRVLKYEPRDLTISVEAGISYRKLQDTLAANHQMIPLDPIFADNATIGGIVGANISGPRRRYYGTARDFVIGMEFAMLNGRLVQSGGMVVKNVAGLDMAKLLIGAFGTLAVMTVINFKLFPILPVERTFAIEFATVAEAIGARDQLIRGPIPPIAIDLMNPALSMQHGLSGWTLLVRFGGNESLMERCDRVMVTLGPSKTGKVEFWSQIQQLSARHMEAHPGGAVVRVSCLLDQVGVVLEELPVAAIARAGTGVIYGYFTESFGAARWMIGAQSRGRYVLMEFASEAARGQYDLWPAPGSDFAIMKKIKQLFDPDALLNRGRLYRRL